MSRGQGVREALAVRARARELATAAQVEEALDCLAAEIAADLSDSDPVIVAVMYGGVFAATEVARRLGFPHEFDYVHLSRYGRSLVGGEIEWIVRPRATLRGRHVLVVDDILDRGITLAALHQELEAIGVASATTAVLVARELPTPQPAVDYVGMRVGDDYVFGCGMDYKGYWRGLPALYAVR